MTPYLTFHSEVYLSLASCTSLFHFMQELFILSFFFPFISKTLSWEEEYHIKDKTSKQTESITTPFFGKSTSVMLSDVLSAESGV